LKLSYDLNSEISKRYNNNEENLNILKLLKQKDEEILRLKKEIEYKTKEIDLVKQQNQLVQQKYEMKVDSILQSSNFFHGLNMEGLINRILLKHKQYKTDLNQIKNIVTIDDNKIIKLKYKIKDINIEKENPINDELVKLKILSEDTARNTKEFENDLNDIESLIFELSNITHENTSNTQSELYSKLEALEQNFNSLSLKYDIIFKKNNSLSLSVEWFEKIINNSLNLPNNSHKEISEMIQVLTDTNHKTLEKLNKTIKSNKNESNPNSPIKTLKQEEKITKTEPPDENNSPTSSNIIELVSPSKRKSRRTKKDNLLETTKSKDLTTQSPTKNNIENKEEEKIEWYL